MTRRNRIVMALMCQDVPRDGFADDWHLRSRAASGMPLVLLTWELLREPDWALKAQQQLGAEAAWPISSGDAVKRRAK